MDKPENSDKFMAVITFTGYGQKHNQAFFAPTVEELDKVHVIPKIRGLVNTAHTFEPIEYYEIKKLKTVG